MSRCPLLRPLVGLTALSAVAVVACGGPPPAPAPEPASRSSGGRLCPWPLLFPEDQVRPRRIRIENQTADTLLVWLDRCYRHTRVAIVPPGRIRQPELPRRLPDYPEGLRFFAYAPGRDQRAGTWVVPAEPVPILRLKITEGSGVDRASLRQFRLPEHEDRAVGNFRVGSTDRGGYATLLSEPRGGVLTLSCVDGRPGLTLTAPLHFVGDSVQVRARSPASEWAELGRWPLRPGPRDALRAPEGAPERVVRLLSHEGAVDVELTGEGPTGRLRFEARGLSAVVAELGCRGSTLPGRAPYLSPSAGRVASALHEWTAGATGEARTALNIVGGPEGGRTQQVVEDQAEEGRERPEARQDLHEDHPGDHRGGPRGRW